MSHPVLYTSRPVPAQPGRPRTSGRISRGPALAAALAARLTARDRWLLRMLHEHRVLTTGQVTQLAFGTSRAATARLLALYQLRAIDRFRPLVPSGSAPLHFVLDEAGAYLLAAEDGITPGQFGYRRDRAGPAGGGQWPEPPPAGPAVTDFFLEYDTGSENLHRVAAKLAGYRNLA